MALVVLQQLSVSLSLLTSDQDCTWWPYWISLRLTAEIWPQNRNTHYVNHNNCFSDRVRLWVISFIFMCTRRVLMKQVKSQRFLNKQIKNNHICRLCVFDLFEIVIIYIIAQCVSKFSQVHNLQLPFRFLFVISPFIATIDRKPTEWHIFIEHCKPILFLAYTHAAPDSRISFTADADGGPTYDLVNWTFGMYVQ